MSLCSDTYVPNSWCSFFCITAWTEATHCSLFVFGCLSNSSAVPQNNAKASHGTACNPEANISHTLSLILLSRMLAWWLAELWRALLWCSHMSQATFHNFLINSAIHLLLDLCQHHCSQYDSCVACQSRLSQPSRASLPPNLQLSLH